MTSFDIVIALVRCLNLTGLAVFAGAMFFRALLVPAVAFEGNTTDALGQSWLRLCQFSLVVSALGLVVWVPLQFSQLAGSNEFGEIIALLPSGLTGTEFGVASCLRALAIVFLFGLLPFAEQSRSVRISLLLIALFGLSLQIRMGHAAAVEEILLPVAVAAHILAGALWFGSLPPLLLLLYKSPDEGLHAARQFSAFGILFVATLALAAAIAAWLLTGGLAGLIGTTYGKIILIKSALFLGMLMLAALNRFWLSGVGRSGAGLKYAVLAEAIIGLTVFVAASLLATQPPAIHEDVIWPFTYRLRGNILRDAFLVDLAWRSLKPVLPLILIGIGCLFLPRWRWPVIASVALVGVFLFQPPRIGLFLEEANEASFQNSPSSYNIISVARGASAFKANCASCHGDDGRGRGPLATGQPVWPPDLTAPLFADRSDGEIFWIINKGKSLKDGRQTMPGFEDALDTKTAWSLVDYIRTIAAARRINLPTPDGEVLPTPAPRIVAHCNEQRREVGGKTDTVWLVALQSGELTVSAIEENGQRSECAIFDETAASTYRLLAPTSPETSFLIDQNGWIRFRWPLGANDDSAMLASAVRTAREQPVKLSNKTHH